MRINRQFSSKFFGQLILTFAISIYIFFGLYLILAGNVGDRIVFYSYAANGYKNQIRNPDTGKFSILAQDAQIEAIKLKPYDYLLWRGLAEILKKSGNDDVSQRALEISRLLEPLEQGDDVYRSKPYKDQ